jgi:hypothetical protein
MSASTTKLSFMKTWWLVLIAISLSTLVFAGDKDKKSAPAPAPAAKPAQQQAVEGGARQAIRDESRRFN